MTDGLRIALAVVVAGTLVLAAGVAGLSWDRMAGALLAGFIALLALYYLLAGLSVMAIFLRAALALLPIGALATVLIIAVPRLEVFEGLESRALIAAIVVAAGWIVAFVTGEWRRVSTEQERRRDMIRAVISEIELIATHGRKFDTEAAITKIKAAYAADPDYRAFIFYGHSFDTLKRLVQQIEILRWQQIRPVMDLFQLLDRLDRMQARISEDAYAALPTDRRRDGLVRFLTLQGQVPDIANHAVAALRDGPFHGWLRSVK